MVGFLDQNCLLNNPFITLVIIPLIIGIIASFFVVIFYDFIIFRRFYLNLCNEIDNNFYKIQQGELDFQYSRIRNILEKKLKDPSHIEWVGLGKIISIWILVQKTDTKPTDYYRYLSSNDLKNFIQRGYYHYIKECEVNLTSFYLYCENVSNIIQKIEGIFNYTPEKMFTNYRTATDDEKRNFLEMYINNIQSVFILYRSLLESEYNQLQTIFKKDIFRVVKLYLSKNF